MKKHKHRTSLVSGLLACLVVSILTPCLSAKGKPPKPDPEPTDPPNPVIAVFENGNIDVMNADGSSRFEVVSGITSRFSVGPTPAWSPDGTQIASFEGGERFLRIINIDGTESNPVQPLPQWTSWWDTYPVAWGEAGIAFLNNETEEQEAVDLYLVQPDGTGLINLTNTPLRHEQSPTWLPDGSLAFVAYFGSSLSNPKEVIVLDLTTTPMTETPLRDYLLGEGVVLPDRFGPIDWANNSNRFSFSSEGSIWVVDLEGDPSMHLVASPGSGGGYGNVSWMANDGELVFTGKSSMKGKDSVYKAPADGTGSPVRLGSGKRASSWGNAPLD